METMTITAVIDDAPLRNRHLVAAQVRKVVSDAIERSPHLILDIEPDSFKGTVTFVVASEHDVTNASTIVHEAVASVEGASIPQELINR